MKITVLTTSKERVAFVPKEGIKLLAELMLYSGYLAEKGLLPKGLEFLDPKLKLCAGSKTREESVVQRIDSMDDKKASHIVFGKSANAEYWFVAAEGSDPVSGVNPSNEGEIHVRSLESSRAYPLEKLHGRMKARFDLLQEKIAKEVAARQKQAKASRELDLKASKDAKHKRRIRNEAFREEALLKQVKPPEIEPELMDVIDNDEWLENL